MRRRFDAVILLMGLFLVTLVAGAQENTRRFSKSWPVAEVETLVITNKFGEVKINSNGGSMVTVDVVVRVEGSGSRDRALLEAVNVGFGKEGRTATAETEFGGNLKTRGNFSIDYTVNIPPEKNLTVHNKFGNVILNRLTGKGEFHIAYGNLTAGQMTGAPLKLELEYGKADIGTMGEATVLLSYYKLFLGTGSRMVLDSKYSVLNADKLQELQLESKYDSFEFGAVASLEGESKFTNYRIGTLERRLKLVSAYGSVKVDQVPAGFELLEVTSSYAQVSLGIDGEAAWEVDASCEYCNISYPEAAFKGNRIKENTRESVHGRVGSGNPGVVRVISKYGNIRLGK